MIEPVAEALGNTVAISRKSYVHPALVEAAKERPRDPLPEIDRPRARKWLSSAEVGLLSVPVEAASAIPQARLIDGTLIERRPAAMNGTMRDAMQWWSSFPGLGRGEQQIPGDRQPGRGGAGRGDAGAALRRRAHYHRRP